MDIVEFQSREDVRAVLEDDRAVPSLPSLRDAIEIDGEVCRLTIGTLTLLQAARNEIFFSKKEDLDKPLEDYEIFECFWLCNERNVDLAVHIADNPKELKKTVEKFMRSYSKKKRFKICTEVFEWISSQLNTIEQIGDGEDAESRLSVDWFIEGVDILASNYAWSEEFIMWRLPLVRAMKYQEAIITRLSGERRSEDIRDETIKALELLEKERKNGTS